MGQYGNQPDFGTRAIDVIPTGSNQDVAPDVINLKSAALYIGTGGTLTCSVVGGNANDAGLGFTVFKNIPNGTFFPVVVKYVFIAGEGEGTTTTCSDIVALY